MYVVCGSCPNVGSHMEPGMVAEMRAPCPLAHGASLRNVVTLYALISCTQVNQKIKNVANYTGR